MVWIAKHHPLLPLRAGGASAAALTAAVDTPQLVIAEAVTPMEVPDSVGAPVGSRQPVGFGRGRPSAAVMRTDRQRPELVERETPVQEMLGDVLDPVQYCLDIG